MMSAILRELALMVSMVRTTWPTTSPPRVAASDAVDASWLAWRAESALCDTVPVSSTSELAALCRLCEVCSVRWLRSRLPDATSELATRMESAVWPISPTRVRRRSCMAAIASSRRPVSSWMRTSTCEVRSPRAMRSATTTARPMGAVMLVVMRHAISAPRPMASATSRPPTRRAWLWVFSADAVASAFRLFCNSISSRSLARQAVSPGATRVISASVALTVSPSSAALMALASSGRALRPSSCTSASSLISAGVAPSGVSSAARAVSWVAYSLSVLSTASICARACLGSMSLSMAAERLWMPMALTLSSMPLTSLALLAPVPVIWCICPLTWLTDSWPRAATAMMSTSMQPKPRLSRLEIDKDLREAAAGMEVLVSRWASGDRGIQVGAS